MGRLPRVPRLLLYAFGHGLSQVVLLLLAHLASGGLQWHSYLHQADPMGAPVFVVVARDRCAGCVLHKPKQLVEPRSRGGCPVACSHGHTIRGPLYGYAAAPQG